MTDRLTERHEGRGFSFAHPAAASIEVDADDAVLESVVIRDADEPVMIAASLEQSPVETPSLRVPGMLGQLLRKYEALGGYELRLYSRLPVEGSAAADRAEIVYGAGDPRQAFIVTAVVTDDVLVTLQVHFPPSTADTNRPLALAILDSLSIRSGTDPLR